MSFIRAQNDYLFKVLITEFHTINFFALKREQYPDPCQTSKIERFAKVVSGFWMFDRVLNTPLISDNLL